MIQPIIDVLIAWVGLIVLSWIAVAAFQWFRSRAGQKWWWNE
jgi:hypothetical protein